MPPAKKSKTKASSSAAPALAPSTRLMSIDVLRGFVMFWIIGGDQIAPLLAKGAPSPFANALAAQFDHVPWNGLVFYDLIFPTFMFLAGASMPFSFEKHLQAGGSRQSLLRKIFLRALTIVALGLVYNGILKFEGYHALRLPGVLQRIGITYFFGALITLGWNLKGRIFWVVGLLLSYWAAMAWIPVPGFGAGVLTPEGSLAGYVDRLLLSGQMCCYGLGDNEGFVSTIPAIATVLLGGFAGLWLKSLRAGAQKAAGLCLAGLIAFALGWAWNPWLQVNKNLWTSSFVLAAGGCSAFMLGICYFLVDLSGKKAWAFAFMLIGMNSITIYLGQEIVNFDGIAKYFLEGLAKLSGIWGEMVLALGSLAVKIGALYFLWKQRVFLKV